MANKRFSWINSRGMMINNIATEEEDIVSLQHDIGLTNSQIQKIKALKLSTSTVIVVDKGMQLEEKLTIIRMR